MQSHSESESESSNDQVEELRTLSIETQNSGAPTAFANASDFTMYNPSFVIHHGNTHNVAYCRKKPKLSRGINKVREGSRFYAATRTCGPSVTSNVIVQEFEGSSGMQQWEKTLHWIPHSLNPHLLRVVGISPPSISLRNPRYIVYKGASRSDPRLLIASLLAERDRERLAGVGSRVVYGIASGLDYLSKAGTVLRLADIGIENFDVFSNDNGHSMVCFTPELVGVTPQESEMSDVAVFNSFMTKLFSDANYILHREKLDRIDDDIVSEEFEAGMRGSYGPQAKGKSKAIEFSLEEPAQSLDSDRCRREITWMYRCFNLTLSEMSKSYGDLLYFCLPSQEEGNSTSIPLPQHYGKRWSEVEHECHGYCREEITLTPDPFHNKILIFGKPSANERCGLCGEIVRLQSSPQSDQYSESTSTQHVSEYPVPNLSNSTHTLGSGPTPETNPGILHSSCYPELPHKTGSAFWDSTASSPKLSPVISWANNTNLVPSSAGIDPFAPWIFGMPRWTLLAWNSIIGRSYS